MAAAGQDQQPRESHLITLKVMRLSRPSLVTGQGLYFSAPSLNQVPSHSVTASSSPSSLSLSQTHSNRPNTTSILTDALSDLSLSQLERVHPPSLTSSQPGSLSRVQRDGTTHDNNNSSCWEEALDMGDYGVSELLTMPASFGSIYLGETFTSYICANNESTHPVRDVILKAELQTSTSATRFALTDILAQQRQLTRPVDSTSAAPVSTGGHIQLLESGKTNEMIVAHEIKELGTHILSCSIQYTTLDGQQKSFRKFYKFQVLNPLSVKTKVNHPTTAAPSTAPSTSATAQSSGANGGTGSTSASVAKGGLVVLEALIQNMSGVTMWMERMRFEVADAFTVQDLNVVIEDDEDVIAEKELPDHGQKEKGKHFGNQGHEKPSSTAGAVVNIFGEHDYFAPNDVRQYLYVLTPKPGKELLAKSTNVLGKMDILWRTQFGETGRLHTSQLTRKPMPLEEIAVQVVKVPETIRLEEVFSIDIVVKNQTLGSGLSSSPQQQQQQHQMQGHGPDQRPLRPFVDTQSGSVLNPPPQALGGTLARPPAAVARGTAITPNRPADNLHQPHHSHQQSQSQASLTQDQNSMKLMLTGVKQKMGAILLSGPNSRQLGSVPAGGEVRVRLDWFPLTSGVQKIGGIRIVDIISGYTIELDHLTHCFVEHT
ncbi:hypothetical protein BGZ83_008117 [Gryganskiella cystojenkinii]|nr:hypothetical protein BGZ83_008117 [Gryganskiella cystojenkinii]